jgi:pyruvate/2-oxoglutarate dehydrogenase complex dihydrolipoamide dehydrogenase (E3) component
MLFHKFVVIGAGEAGLRISKQLAKEGHDVLIIEKNEIGGSFIFSKDLPKKSLGDNAKTIQKYNEKFDDIKTIEAKEKIKDNLNSQIDASFKNLSHELNNFSNLTILHGVAKFSSRNLLELIKNDNTKEIIAFEECIICTGKSSIKIPLIKGVDKIELLHQHNAFFGDIIPEKLGILGIDKFNCEVADIFSALGTKVFIFDSRTPEQILPKHDSTNVNYLLQSMLQKKVELFFNIHLEDVNITEDQLLEITDKQGNSYNLSHLFTNVAEEFEDNLNLDKINVKYNEKGIFSSLDGQTVAKNIWVFGEAANNFKKQNLNIQIINLINKFNSKHLKNQDYSTKNFLSVANRFINDNEFSNINYFYEKIELIRPVATIGLPYRFAVAQFGTLAKFTVLFHPVLEGYIKITYHEKLQRVLGFALSGEICEEFFNCSIDLLQRESTTKETLNILYNLEFTK